ncbi:ABC transporter permease [Bauldia sp.]|uniref:ABC transporter permease n=1 Tax=Bauldia sp. TaxID=2575872 RepID=UPI003BA925CC
MTAIATRRWVFPANAVSVAAVLIGIVVLWDVVSRTILAGQYVLAGPVDIVARLWTDAPLYGRALEITLYEAALGFLFGNTAAIVLAAFVALIPASERTVQGLALVVFCLPLVATGPVLRVLFGPGDGPQITLAALAVYYTTFVPLVVGLRAIPDSWSDLVASYGRGRWQTLITVRARASVPYLVAGLKVAAPAAVLGAMVGEFTGAERGMGVLVIQAIRSLDVEATWAIATLATAASIAAYLLAVLAGRLLSPGSPPMLFSARPADAAQSFARRFSVGVLAILGTTVLILAIWQGAMAWFDLSPFFAKRPGDIFAYLVTAPNAVAHRAEVFGALGETLAVTIPGYFAGLAVGVLMACLFELFPLARQTMTPIAIALRSVPIITTAPLLIMAFGRGAAGLVVIVAVMTFFPTLVACAEGLRRVPGQVTDFFDSFAAGRVRTLFLARLPAMLPAFFAAARIAVPTAVLAATVAEWLSTGTGIGNLMALTYSTSAYNILWSCVVVLTFVSVIGYALVAIVERLVLLSFAPEQVAR